jgi:hypothetical protein
MISLAEAVELSDTTFRAFRAIARKVGVKVPPNRKNAPSRLSIADWLKVNDALPYRDPETGVEIRITQVYTPRVVNRGFALYRETPEHYAERTLKDLARIEKEAQREEKEEELIRGSV